MLTEYIIQAKSLNNSIQGMSVLKIISFFVLVFQDHVLPSAVGPVM